MKPKPIDETSPRLGRAVAMTAGLSSIFHLFLARVVVIFGP